MILDALEGFGSDGGWLRVPGDERLGALQEFFDAFAAKRAGTEVRAEATPAAEILDLFGGEARSATVGARGNEDLGAVFQLLEPELDALQGIVIARGIEEDERQIGIVEEERVDEAVVGLSGEIPENGLALRAVGALGGELIEEPELLPVS